MIDYSKASSPDDVLNLINQKISKKVTFDSIKDKLIEFIDRIEVDVTSLDSYRESQASQDFSRFREPADEYWDEEEEYAARLQKAREYLEYDGVYDSLDIPNAEHLKGDCIKWIDKEIERVY